MRSSSLLSPPTRLTAHAVAARPQGLAGRWLLLPLLALAVLFAAVDPADAKRLGGNKSFGSRDSYSKSYDKPAPPAKNATTTQQQATPNPQGGPAQGGFLSKFGGVGGMLGGLLVGGMLGSLLFGGMGGGVGVLEIMLLCLAGYMVFRFIRARRSAQANPAGQAAPMGGDRFAYAGAGGQPAPAPDADGWGALRQAQANTGGAAAHEHVVRLPDGVDEAEFVSGAKALFSRLQASWDRRDLADIESFTSPEVFAEIKRQAEENPTPGRTEVLMVEARVIEAANQGGRTVITVLYDALMREDPADARSVQTREVWHISRDEASSSPSWVLEGIQQLES